MPKDFFERLEFDQERHVNEQIGIDPSRDSCRDRGMDVVPTQISRLGSRRVSPRILVDRIWHRSPSKILIDVPAEGLAERQPYIVFRRR